jgi:hypothetical protein
MKSLFRVLAGLLLATIGTPRASDDVDALAGLDDIESLIELELERAEQGHLRAIPAVLASGAGRSKNMLDMVKRDIEATVRRGEFDRLVPLVDQFKKLRAAELTAELQTLSGSTVWSSAPQPTTRVHSDAIDSDSAAPDDEGAKYHFFVVFCVRRSSFSLGRMTEEAWGIEAEAQRYRQASTKWAGSLDHVSELVDASVAAGIKLTIVDKNCSADPVLMRPDDPVNNIGVAARWKQIRANLPGNVKVLSQPNTGRETLGYLGAIVNHYSSLAERNVFLQDDYAFMDDGGPFRVGGPSNTLHNIHTIMARFSAKYQKNQKGAMFRGRFSVSINWHHGAGWKLIADNVISRGFRDSADCTSMGSGAVGPVKCADDIWSHVATAHAGAADLPSNWRGSYGDCCAYFAATRSSILAYSLEFWQKLLRTALVSALVEVPGFKCPSHQQPWPSLDDFVSLDCGLFLGQESSPCRDVATHPDDYLCSSFPINGYAFEGMWGPLFGDFEGSQDR